MKKSNLKVQFKKSTISKLETDKISGGDYSMSNQRTCNSSPYPYNQYTCCGPGCN